MRSASTTFEHQPVLHALVWGLLMIFITGSMQETAHAQTPEFSASQLELVNQLINGLAFDLPFDLA